MEDTDRRVMPGRAGKSSVACEDKIWQRIRRGQLPYLFLMESPPSPKGWVSPGGLERQGNHVFNERKLASTLNSHVNPTVVFFIGKSGTLALFAEDLP